MTTLWVVKMGKNVRIYSHIFAPNFAPNKGGATNKKHNFFNDMPYSLEVPENIPDVCIEYRIATPSDLVLYLESIRKARKENPYLAKSPPMEIVFSKAKNQ